MFSSLALAAMLSLTPAQSSGTLTLSNARVTYGELGTTRTDTKFFPGDIYFISFDIDGIKVDDSGRVQYVMAMEVVDSANKSIFKQQPVERNDYLPLGGTKLPARAFVTIGLDQAPGTYTCKVTVTDKNSKASQTLEKKFEVLAKTFAIVQTYTASDDAGRIPAPTQGVTGQAIWVHFAVVGFDRDRTSKQPNINVEMFVLGSDGKRTLTKPASFSIKEDVQADAAGIPLRFLLPMNRAGEFTVELTATDTLSKKVSKMTLPIKVVNPQ